MKEEVAVIAGANVGLGSALAERLRERGSIVYALGRERATRDVAAEVEGTHAIICDLTDAHAVDLAFARIEAESGPATAVVYNAHRIDLRAAADTGLALFEESWRVNCFGAFVVAQRAMAAMVAVGRGALVFSGATGSVRGGKRSAAFASSKFALRGLAQSLARELGPLGVHVAHVILDGLIWSERSKARFSAVEEDAMSPKALAEIYLGLIAQERSAWTHEVDVRPWRERF